MPRGIKGTGHPKVAIKSKFYVVPMADVDTFKAGDYSVAVVPPTAGKDSAVNLALAAFQRDGVTSGQYVVVRALTTKIYSFGVAPLSGIQVVPIKG